MGKNKRRMDTDGLIGHFKSVKTITYCTIIARKMHLGFIARVLFLVDNYLMKDMIAALIECGYEFDMAITLSENYQDDNAPILTEKKDVDRVS